MLKNVLKSILVKTLESVRCPVRWGSGWLWSCPEIVVL